MSPPSTLNFRQRLRRYFSTHPTLSRTGALAWLGERLHDPELWHFGRRAVANGLGAGLCIAFLPVPGQMLCAAGVAIALRANLPLAVAATWLTNPFTFAPMTWLVYSVGSALTGQTVSIQSLDLSLSLVSLRELLGHVGKPFLLGSLACALAAGLGGNLLVRLLWRLHLVKRWRARRLRPHRRTGAD